MTATGTPNARPEGSDGRPGRFEGRAALVTGGSRGIGLAIARGLLDEGASVAITGLSPDNLTRAADTLGRPDRVLTLPADAAHLSGIDATVDAVVDRFGSIDLLVNNAAVTAEGRLTEIETDYALEVLKANTVAPWRYSRRAWERGMAEHGGAIVNIVSMAAFRYPNFLPWYSVSKAALVRQTEVLAAELGPKVRVNAASPATTVTDRARPYLTDGRDGELIAEYPLARLGEPEDVARAVAFLLSDDASFVSGATLFVDGASTTYASGWFC
jgi:3-oxoacyl-[acyl-carrier protein] reductase